MKLNYVLMALAATLVSSASGALYTMTTGASATANGIVNADGVGFQNSASASFAGPGTVSFGTFVGIADSEIASASTATLVAAFRLFGVGGVFTAPALSANRSTFSRAESMDVDMQMPQYHDFNGATMYLFAGNAANATSGNTRALTLTALANSSQWLVLKTPFLFNSANDAISTPTTLTITTANTTLLAGKAVADVRTTGTDASVTAGWAMVPETSTVLLGALGALSLLRRRR